MCSTPRSSPGSQYPAGIFNCRQIWSGVVQNYIPGVRLTGNLRISPAITKDGKLRIAKATVNTSQPTHVALSACLMPYRSYARIRPRRLPDDHGRRWPGHVAGNPDAGPGNRRYAVARDDRRRTACCRTTATSCRSRTSVPPRRTLSVQRHADGSRP